jgi:glucose dehydrogenase
VAAAPALIDVVRDGKKIPAVAQITKMGLLFILDRLTGQPIYGVEERPVPKSDVPGEESWPTQPFPLKPPPLSRNSFRPSEISRISPETEKFCTEMAAKYINEGPYTPYRVATSMVLFPGVVGGGNWGGVSFDPATGYIIVNTSEMGTLGHMVKTDPPSQTFGAYRNELGITRFVDQDHYPCQQPPWGRLTAVNANTGDIAWSRTLGSYDELEAKGLKDLGAANLGGAITTASGLLFIAATNDLKFRAFETNTGKELWMARLDASGNATPITYMGRDNRQYVVIAAGGPGHLISIGKTAADKSDTIVAFALPQ